METLLTKRIKSLTPLAGLSRAGGSPKLCARACRSMAELMEPFQHEKGRTFLCAQTKGTAYARPFPLPNIGLPEGQKNIPVGWRD